MKLALIGQHLLTSSSAEIISDGAVVIEGDKVIEVGPRSQVDLSTVDEVRDLGEVTIMPGLFDCHVHLAFDPGAGTTSTSVALADDALAALMSANATKLLDAGVTTARDLGSPGTSVNAVRASIRSGDLAGPNLQVAHAPLTVPGGHACAMGGEVDGLTAIRAAVRQRATDGADVIKVMTTGGFMTAGTHPWQARFSVEELRAAVEEAHSQGLLTTTHALGVEGIGRAVEAGFDAIEHCGWVTEDGTRFDEQIAAQIVAKGIFVSPTMNSACMRDHYFCPWDEHDAIVSNLARMRRMGIKVIAGTDAGIGLVHFERYADGLEVLSDAGFTNREILAATTSDAASALGLTASTGELCAGKQADILAVAGNPVQSWTALRRPQLVFAAGREHRPRPIPDFGQNMEEMQRIHRELSRGAGRPTPNVD